MIYDEPETMKEIRRIREKHYEETRNLTLEEKMEYFRKKAEEAIRQAGLRLPIVSRDK
ncbi:MAG: hypothetical protein AB1546_00285 [bacterium]